MANGAAGRAAARTALLATLVAVTSVACSAGERPGTPTPRTSRSVSAPSPASASATSAAAGPHGRDAARTPRAAEPAGPRTPARRAGSPSSSVDAQSATDRGPAASSALPAVASTDAGSRASGPHLVGGRPTADCRRGAGADYALYVAVLRVYGPTARHRWLMRITTTSGSSGAAQPLSARAVDGGMEYRYESAAPLADRERAAATVTQEQVLDASRTPPTYAYTPLPYPGGGLVVTGQHCP